MAYIDRSIVTLNNGWLDRQNTRRPSVARFPRRNRSEAIRRHAIESGFYTLREAYELSANRGKFGIVRTGAIFEVVPTVSNNAQGIPTSRSSRLDVRIDLELGQRSVMQTVKDQGRA